MRPRSPASTTDFDEPYVGRVCRPRSVRSVTGRSAGTTARWRSGSRLVPRVVLRSRQVNEDDHRLRARTRCASGCGMDPKLCEQLIPSEADLRLRHAPGAAGNEVSTRRSTCRTTLELVERDARRRSSAVHRAGVQTSDGKVRESRRPRARHRLRRRHRRADPHRHPRTRRRAR